ncbi:hypothetical protein EGW08_020483 [Elysia chlorotica]|uniref:Uncharacterized protein n=1 Tax=Elysia chlorotica TaxID=188477 RepID=A0A433SR83_ELYCH|nr:hypothetical protein EGW08_020483 [Elysia chlorotica]
MLLCCDFCQDVCTATLDKSIIKKIGFCSLINSYYCLRKGQITSFFFKYNVFLEETNLSRLTEIKSLHLTLSVTIDLINSDSDSRLCSRSQAHLCLGLIIRRCVV